MENIHPDVEKILYTEKEVDKIISDVADKLNNDYNNEELVVIVVLRGSMIFASDLIRKLKMPVKTEFIKASSYGSGTSSSGFINIQFDTATEIEGKNVLIVEDIIDSGNTLYRLKNVLNGRKPKSCKICTLLDKPSRRTVEIQADYAGVVVPNEFIVGFGLDYNEYYRNLPYIGTLKREIYE